MCLVVALLIPSAMMACTAWHSHSSLPSAAQEVLTELLVPAALTGFGHLLHPLAAGCVLGVLPAASVGEEAVGTSSFCVQL